MSILIKGARYLNPEFQIIEGDFLIEGSKVVKARKKGECTIDGRKRLLMHSFTNAHTHLPMILFRGLAENLILEEWLEKMIFPLERKLKPEYIYLASLAGLIEMIRTGSTYFISGYFWEGETARAVKDAGLRASIGMTITDFPTPYYKDSDEALRRAEEVLREPKEGRIEFWLAPHSIYSCSKETLMRCRELAEKHKANIQIHASETRSECVDCWKRTGLWPVEYLASINFLSQSVFIAHSSWLTKMEIPFIKKSKAKVVHCPTSNMKLASGATMPLVELLESGVDTLLGTDSPASNNSLSMINEMKFASLVHKAHRWDAKVIAPKEVLRMATFNSKDYILIDLNDIRMLPYHDLLSNLVYSFPQVTDVIVDEHFVMRERQILTLNEQSVLDRFEEMASKLRDSL